MLLKTDLVQSAAGLLWGLALLAPAPLWAQPDGGAAQQPPVADPALADKPRGDSGDAANPARFDEIGYAALVDETALGGVGIAHPDLPVNSFVELTALDTGQTVLALVALKAAAPAGYLITVSPGAARLLGGGGEIRPVRVRRVNPPGSDQQALREGRAASPRLGAPEILLTGLRRRLPTKPGDGGFSASTAAAKAPSAPPAPTLRKPVARGGLAPAAQSPAVKPVASRGAVPGARYAVPGAGKSAPAPEETGTPAPPVSSAKAARRAAPSTPAAAPTPAPSGAYFVQIAALSNMERAEALAKSVGGHAQSVGAIYRVRLGPFSSAQAAQQARDDIAKRGYGSARVTH